MVPPPDAAVNVAVPELLVPDVAVNELTLVAFAVAPELTTRTSLCMPDWLLAHSPVSEVCHDLGLDLLLSPESWTDLVPLRMEISSLS